mmetsp:Transcript_34336/g.50477  ORF Transcript_34336/g.50477 Transcript_34336/m.50477 type:complete len:579 (-) Transcript_34336:310-2046(-)|eukprot:CAMPEP_0195525434 /NCGR_PEP_ID=MMETSP0794_2-20130614/25901_1 /TAXON_ID=515487 /ORGANISM="Stephanopyxis turris, Strain CCMP 815" /LENGTH=578 /DNA_ID=CAMNT_0040655899 /DNA_START=65 /DNA_END=1801 /DNA_ORIENTATION=-
MDKSTANNEQLQQSQEQPVEQEQAANDSVMINSIENIQTKHSDRSSDRSIMSREEETFYSAVENKHGDDNIWGLLSGVGGNVYEWYDFAVYGLLATEIGSNFFPKSSEMIQLMSSFGVYLAAFIMRPLGAILFGELGDRLVGRKNALMFSIILITVPSVLMGLLPTYHTIGSIAPIFLVILRMMQGLSVGGQLAGSYVLSIEQSTSYNRGFRGSVCDASSVGGFLMASAVTTIVRGCFDEETVNDWAWRIPFWFSLALAPLLYFIVNRTEESKFWAERAAQKETEQIIRDEEEKNHSPAMMDILTSPFRRRQLFGVVGVLSVKTSSFYMLFLWTPIYLSNLRGYTTETNADLITFCVVFFYICMLLIMGKLSDKFPHRMDLIRIGLPCVIFACPIMFGMFESESIVGYVLGELQYAACLSMVQGGMAAWEVELWMADPSLSFTGVAVGHNMASSLFGGTMPLIATYLFYLSNGKLENVEDDKDLWIKMIPSFYVSALGVLSLFCISHIIRHPHDVRTGEMKLRKIMKKKRREEGAASWDVIGYLSSGSSALASSSFLDGQLSGNKSSTYVPPKNSAQA